MDTRSLLGLMDCINYSYLYSPDPVERKITTVCAFFLLSEIMHTVRTAEQVEEYPPILSSPLLLVDMLMYLTLDGDIDSKIHSQYSRYIQTTNNKSTLNDPLYSYALSRGNVHRPITIDISYDRIVEILAMPSLISCLPDPSMYTLCTVISQYSPSEKSRIKFIHLTYDEWIPKWNNRTSLPSSPLLSTLIELLHSIFPPGHQYSPEGKLNVPICKDSAVRVGQHQQQQSLQHRQSRLFNPLSPVLPALIRIGSPKRPARLLTKKATFVLGEDVEEVSIKKLNEITFKEFNQREMTSCEGQRRASLALAEPSATSPQVRSTAGATDSVGSEKSKVLLRSHEPTSPVESQNNKAFRVRIGSPTIRPKCTSLDYSQRAKANLKNLRNLAESETSTTIIKTGCYFGSPKSPTKGTTLSHNPYKLSTRGHSPAKHSEGTSKTATKDYRQKVIRGIFKDKDSPKQGSTQISAEVFVSAPTSQPPSQHQTSKPFPNFFMLKRNSRYGHH